MSDPAQFAFAQVRGARIEVGSRWEHRKGGRYTVVAVGVIEATLTPAVVYRSGNGNVWVRPLAEFLDGRFVRVMPHTTPIQPQPELR